MKTIIAIFLGIGLGFIIGIQLTDMRAVATHPVGQLAASGRQSNSVPVLNSQGDGHAQSNGSGTEAWLSVVSTNDETFIENLRGIGCPEQTISAIFLGECLRRLTRDDGGAQFSHGISSNLRSVIARRRRAESELTRLGLEQLETPGDYFFSAEQLIKARESMGLFSRATNRVQVVEKYQRRLDYLAPLSEDQTVYFKSEFEHFGSALVSVFAGFLPTQEEFYRIITAMESPDREAIRAKLSTLLTPDRYAQYLEYQSPENQALFVFSKRIAEPEKIMPQLREILQQRGQLSTQEYRNRMLALLGQDRFELLTATFPAFAAKGRE